MHGPSKRLWKITKILMVFCQTYSLNVNQLDFTDEIVKTKLIFQFNGHFTDNQRYSTEKSKTVTEVDQ